MYLCIYLYSYVHISIYLLYRNIQIKIIIFNRYFPTRGEVTFRFVLNGAGSCLNIHFSLLFAQNTTETKQITLKAKLFTLVKFTVCFGTHFFYCAEKFANVSEKRWKIFQTNWMNRQHYQTSIFKNICILKNKIII